MLTQPSHAGIQVVQHVSVMLNCLPVIEYYVSLSIFNKNIFKLRVIYFFEIIGQGNVFLSLKYIRLGRSSQND